MKKQINFRKKYHKLLIIALGIVSVLISLQCYAQDEKENPKSTAIWEPVPVVITPGQGMAPPSDAIILLDGTNLDEWESTKGGAAKWKLEDNGMTVVKKSGSIRTKRSFGDCQLHVEWRSPAVVVDDSQDRGNSGIFLNERYEVQVLDSYENKTITSYLNRCCFHQWSSCRSLQLLSASCEVRQVPNRLLRRPSRSCRSILHERLHLPRCSFLT